MTLFRRIGNRLIEAPYELPIALICVIYGITRLVHHSVTPGTIEHLLPRWLVLMWTIALLLGGVATIFGRFTGWLRTEAAGQIGIAYGFALYGGVLLAAIGGEGLFAGLGYLFVALAAVLRVRTLSTALREPRGGR